MLYIIAQEHSSQYLWFFYISFAESLKKPTLAKSLTETLKSLSLNPNVETIVDITISKSHEIVVDEIRTVLKDKLRALNALGKFNL